MPIMIGKNREYGKKLKDMFQGWWCSISLYASKSIFFSIITAINTSLGSASYGVLAASKNDASFIMPLVFLCINVDLIFKYER
jgi:hypothetical protein